MYKAIFCSHLDYCDTIYHVPTILLNGKLKELNTKLPLILLVRGKDLTGQNLTRNWDGKPYLTVFCACAFFRFTRLRTT